MRKLIVGSLFVLGFMGIERLCHKVTGGFAVQRIVYPIDEELAMPDEMTLKSQVGLDALVTQTFSYLDSGAQVYAFVSEDGQYVLKFFKFHHMRIPFWAKDLPLPAPLDEYRSRKLEKKRKVIHEIFESFTIAKNRLSEETGLVFLHLRKSDHLKGMMTIQDNCGVRFTLDPNRMYFVLQKRADLAYRKIDEWMAAGEVEKAREGVSSLIQLAYARCKKGIFDKDPDFSTNFGFIEDKAIQVDIGRFFICPARQSPPDKEIINITRAFRDWLEDNYPALVGVLDEEIERVTHEYLD